MPVVTILAEKFDLYDAALPISYNSSGVSGFFSSFGLGAAGGCFGGGGGHKILPSFTAKEPRTTSSFKSVTNSFSFVVIELRRFLMLLA